MNKVYSVIAAVMCVLLLAACTKKDPMVEIAQAVEEGGTMVVSTPYADLKVPEVYQGSVTSEVTGTEPYTVTFRADADGTELFSVIFGGTGEILLGTLHGEEGSTVVYANIPALDGANEHYTEYTIYQEGINTILNHLSEDYQFSIGSAEESEDRETFSIEAGGMTFEYPAAWKDTVEISVTEEGVSFSGKGCRLFDLRFAEGRDTFLLGTYAGTPIYVATYEIDQTQYFAEEYDMLRMMQDDVNVILEHLMEDPEFTVGG